MSEPRQAPDVAPDSDAREITRFLRAGGLAGSSSPETLEQVLREIERLASRRRAAEPQGLTLQTADLVTEVYLRLRSIASAHWPSRGHFFAMVTTALVRILADHARRKRRKKRGGDHRQITLAEEIADRRDLDDGQLLEMADTLDVFDRIEPQAATVARLRLFVGLSCQEIAADLGMSLRHCERMWTVARAWLRDRLTQDRDT